MGAARRKVAAKRQAFLQDILEQHDDIVQVPLQVSDGWFRGVSQGMVPVVLDLWEKEGRGRELWLYRIDRYWVKRFWQTSSGNLANRGELMIDIRTNEFAKQLWLNTVTQPQFIDSFREQIEAVKKGELGSIQFWWLKRYLLCRSLDSKLPINYWEYYPIVEVHSPDGTVTDRALDLADYLDSKKSFFQDPKKIESKAPWETKVFADCIKCQEL